MRWQELVFVFIAPLVAIVGTLLVLRLSRGVTSQKRAHYPPFTTESVQRMLTFLPRFERGEFREVESLYRQNGQDAPQVDQLAGEVYQSGFVFPFNWVNYDWRQALSDIEIADMITLRKLMTAFVRGDRFSGGALANLCSNGSVERVLRRLNAIAKTTGNDAVESASPRRAGTADR